METEYLMACEQFAAKKYAEANKLFAEYLAKYPLDPRSPAILLLMNQQNIAEEKWDEAISAWRRLVSKYPGTNQASRAQYLIGVTLEQKLGHLEEALEEYRKVTWGSAAGDAQVAAARLTAKTMTVSTERVFRSDETPKLKLVTRNIESVTVRAFKVDLETYFRKMHLARGVEGLDISLIDPDTTFEFKVPKYVKHQEIESLIEVPLPVRQAFQPDRSAAPSQAGRPNVPGQAGKPDVHGGVMAVTVSSKALEATTMVVQSDLDVIVKSSRDEVFVFAENMLTGKPWPGVRLLISNGHEVIGEGTTDAHGVFQKSYKDFTASTGGVPAETAPPINAPANEALPNSQPVPAPAPPAPPQEATPQAAPPTPPTTAPPPPAPSASYTPADAPRPVGWAECNESHQKRCSAAQPPSDDIIPVAAGSGLNAVPAVQQVARPPAAVEKRGVPLNSNDIRVFAVIDNNVASNMLNLQGVGVAQGLTDKGYIYTDRPAYRAGQLVNIRGCLRRAADDAYVIDKDKSYTVEVFDARNRPIRQEKVKLDAFGSFHAHFVLPPNSPQGQYRVLVHDNGSQNFQGTFLVHEYQLEPIRLVIDTPRRVYYRGEPIEGTIRAEFYYGAPRGRPRDPLPTGRRPPADRHHRRQGRGQDQPADPRVQRVASPAAFRATARGQCQHAGQFRAGRPGILHRREHRAAGLRDGRVAGGHRECPRRREQAAGPEAEAQGLRADAGQWPAGRAAGRGARAGHGRRRQGPADASSSTRAATISCGPRRSIASTIRSRGRPPCRSAAKTTSCGSASWPTSTPTRSATRPPCSCTGETSRRWRW